MPLLKFYSSAPLLMIKKSQSAREILDSYCGKTYSSGVLKILIIDFDDMLLVQFFFFHEEN